MIRRASLTIAFLILLGLPGTNPARAAPPDQQPPGPITLDVRAGFDGYIEPNTYAPVTVLASNTGDDVKGDLTVEVTGLTGGGTSYAGPAELPRGSRKQIRLYPANFASFGNEITVNLNQAGRVIATQKVKVSYIDQGRLLIGVWSDTPGPLASLGKITTDGGKAAVANLTLDDLPPVTEAWGALDVLVISNTDTGKLSPEQQAALAGWINHGGRLIIALGPDFQRTLAGLGSFSPLVADSTEDVSLSGFGQATGKPFPQSADVPVATGKLAPDAHSLLSDGGTPLIIWRQVGYGRVDLLAADPGLEPLRSWGNMEALWTLVLDDGEARPAWAYGFGSSGPAEQAVAAVPGVTLPSVLELCGFLMAYIVLIGPVNYLVLWRLKRRELAWITIPLLVLLFSGIAYFTGFQLRGTQAILHRLAVIQTWPGADSGEVRMLFGVWSPGRTAYDIQIEPGYLARPLPRDFSGALTSSGSSRIESGQNVTLRGVQVDIGSIQPFVIEGFMQKAPRIDGRLTMIPTEDGLRLEGEIVNYSSISLTKVSLITPIGSARIDDLPAGGVLKVDEPLVAGYASAAGGSGLEPYPSNAGYYYYGPYSSGSLGSDLAAGEDCYDSNQDHRRCNFASSILTGEARGSAVYLAGWSDTIPLRTQVLNASSQQKDVLLIIAQMSTSLAQNASAIKTIPPGLMTWKLSDQSGGYSGSTPYGLYLTGGSPVVLQFQPLSFVALPGVEKLILHMDSYDQTALPVVELWNFAEARWEAVQVKWGDTTIENKDYVDSLGGVSLRVSTESDANNSSYGINLNQLDVTLVGQ